MRYIRSIVVTERAGPVSSPRLLLFASQHTVSLHSAQIFKAYNRLAMGEDAALQSLPPPSKIICIGKSYTHNYGRSTPKPRPEPLLFIKPPSSHTTGTSFCIPCDDDGEPLTAAVEVELCVIISRRCKDLRVGEAHEYVSGYGENSSKCLN